MDSPLSSTRQRVSKMSAQDAREFIKSRWQVANDVVEVLLEAVDEGRIPPDEVYPTIPHTIASTVSALFGLTHGPNGYQDLDLTTVDGALTSRILSTGIRSPEQVGSRS